MLIYDTDTRSDEKRQWVEIFPLQLPEDGGNYEENI